MCQKAGPTNTSTWLEKHFLPTQQHVPKSMSHQHINITLPFSVPPQGAGCPPWGQRANSHQLTPTKPSPQLWELDFPECVLHVYNSPETHLRSEVDVQLPRKLQNHVPVLDLLHPYSYTSVRDHFSQMSVGAERILHQGVSSELWKWRRPPGLSNWHKGDEDFAWIILWEVSRWSYTGEEERGKDRRWEERSERTQKPSAWLIYEPGQTSHL